MYLKQTLCWGQAKMTINSSYDKFLDLTMFIVEGTLTFEMQIKALQKFYTDKPSANMLWDFRKITGTRISSEEVQKLIAFMKGYKDKRPHGKTALVSTKDLDFGLSRMSATYAKIENIPWEIQAFHSLEEALDWLK